MKKIFSFIFLLNILFISYSEEEKQNFHLSISPFIEYTKGVLEESLFESKTKDSRMLSLLEWEKDFFLYGINSQLSFKNFNVSTNFSKAFPNQKSGKMYDSDWENDNKPFIKTNYSVGENSLIENFNLDTSLRFDFNIVKELTIAPIFQIQYAYDEFSRDGKKTEGWYNRKGGWWYEDTSVHYPYTKTDDDGTVHRYRLAGVEYYRKSFYLWLGFFSNAQLSKNLSINFSTLISPFAFFDAMDTHLAKDSNGWYGKHYRERQNSFFSHIKLELETNISISKIFDIVLNVNYFTSLKISRGSFEQDYYADCYQGGFIESGQASGESINQLSLKLGCKFKIF